MASMSTDIYYRREVVTDELDWLGDELCRRTGRPRTAAGTKGNLAHKNGAHRSNEFCKRSSYSTSRTYTVQSGLTAEQERHIAAVDFVPGDWGSARNRQLMVEQTRRLVDAMLGGRLPGVREVIGTLDGRTVTAIRSDGSRFTSDSSHLDHWHLTLDRRRCADRPLMERILAIALGTTPPPALPAAPLEVDMILVVDQTGTTWVTDGVRRRALTAYESQQDLERTGVKRLTVKTAAELLDRAGPIATDAPAPPPIDYDKLADALLRRIAATPPS